MIVEERKNKMEMPLFFFCIFNVFHPGVAGIIAPVGGPGSDIINEGLKLYTIGRQ